MSAWLLLIAPLLAALLVLVLFAPYRYWASWLCIGAAGISTLIALGIFFGWVNAPSPWPWFEFGELVVPIGMRLDTLSKLMLVVVTTVALLIEIYSLGYMAHDPGQGRFFGMLSFFLFSMLGIVVADNFLQMYIFWELVGLASYLLIGFWFERPSAAEAAKKAFIVNRIGDFGFIAGILSYWAITGSLSFDVEVAHRLASHPLAWLVTLLLFCGCVGKSAQVPLHVWLPDAMEGPTPVSALIHAATMVAAGVYMLCRAFAVFQASPQALEVIAWTGGTTALFAGLLGVAQNDIKRILAYSTMSQLGLMVMGVGCGSPGAAMFHLTTHAFFKALLFLGAGSVLVALHHREQNIWRMGALYRYMPQTFACFLVGALALTGVPGVSGFYSKETLLRAAWSRSLPLFAVGLATTFLTALYMTRLVIVSFLGEPRSEIVSQAKESPLVMGVPLLLLSLASIGSGYRWVGIPEYLGVASEHTSFAVPLLSLLVVGLGFATGCTLYLNRSSEPLHMRLLEARFYVDELYDRVIVWAQDRLAWLLSWLDQWLIGFGVVRGIAFVVSLGGEILRLVQVGNVRFYAFVFSLGAALFFLWFLGK
ncbi:NADH-quinone oxidoreductase subunit L [Candidatus Methylacidithermus pantelleriae]|uniref:NADH quinone-oxidoreductase subunit L n=1 Tax=Candidatus Methylacidithermus pantelleriae TaxID=2744239 RepID=A0A8J2BQ18_9BACT|nr:NADH-quinone oxidoreductase subunit L [Candidatus Methylacidithermus pantelleriae]CAF0700766.1 NADH quinone-oxidoreductase subunit L [Candidatus Methylacidithermus pantelleriae]